MTNVWNVAEKVFDQINDSLGFAGSLLTFYDFLKNKDKDHIQETLDVMEKKSKAAYGRYCQYRKYREKDLGVPTEEKILGYWKSCMERSVLPSAGDMVNSGIACREEAEVLMPYLMEQWRTVPEFSEWLHLILNREKLEEISDKLSDLSGVLETALQFNQEPDLQDINSAAVLLTPAVINDAKHSCNKLDIKNFFTVDNNFYTMLRVISAEEDIPDQNAAKAVMDLLQKSAPVIITGNGGQGKTSLMMSAAAQWAASGKWAVWMTLSNKEIVTEQDADRFFSALIQAVPEGQRILLCIDNPYEGQKSFANLQIRWPHNTKIQLLMAERENRLTLLADPAQDRLLYWFDNSHLIVLQGIGSTRDYSLKDYQACIFQESPERRKTILEKCTSYLVEEGVVSRNVQQDVTKKVLKWYGKPNVSLVELIYRTLFELKKVASKPESIKLDWEEWGELVNKEFGNVDSSLQLYGVIAALKVFNVPLSLSLFCRYFELSERKLRSRLCERFVPRHVEPVIYNETSKTLQTKHDVIAELFFLFNKNKVSIDSLIGELIKTMNENEIETFLSNVMIKKEVKKGKKPPIGRIAYWQYVDDIYSRTQSGMCNLSREARAYLCMGALWAEKEGSWGSARIYGVLEKTAPEIEENDLLLAKLYTEWGIWEARKNHQGSAEEKFLTVIKYNPEQLPARTELGRLLSKQKGREGEAEKYLKEVIGIDAKNIMARTELGRLLSKQKGREGEAEKYLKEAMKIEPKHIQSRTELGRLLSKQKGREEEAEKYLKEAIGIDPQNLHPHTELGRLLSKQKGREEEAEKYLKEVIRIDPENLHSRTVLAELYESEGRLTEAKQLYQELIDLDPKNQYGKKGLSRLKSI